MQKELDKVGDAIKEFSIRVVDGSDTTAEGFAAIGLSADEMAAKFAQGGDAASQAFDQTIQRRFTLTTQATFRSTNCAVVPVVWREKRVVCLLSLWTICS